MFRVVRQHPPFIALGTVLILGAATFVAVPLLAQNGEPQKPAEAGKTEPGKTEPGKTEPGKTEPGKTEAGKTEPAKPEAGKAESTKDAAGHSEELAESARVLMGPAGRGECVWLGERVISLLAKDDLDTAFRHLELYERFGCPGEHLQLSFRCVVRQSPPGNVDPKEPKDQKAMADFLGHVNDRVHACWMNPATPAALANPPTAAVEKPGNK
jgi:hypothetical protein